MAGDGVEIGTAYVTILPDGSKIGPEVKKSFGVVDHEADRVGRTSGKKFGGIFSSTASKVMAGAGGIFAAAAVKNFVGEGIGIASDLQEAGTKLDAIFGKASSRVQDFASGGAKALGQSRLDVLDAAATFGVFGKAAGLQGPKLSKFSTRLTQLSTDLASFHNADPSDVVESLGAALRGEAEPMRKYGVMLNDASLKAEALSLGILKPVKDQSKITGYLAKVTIAQDAYNKAVNEFGPKSIEALKAQATLGTAQSSLKKATEGTIPPLTAQQKTLAAQALIFKQTKDAQGDFTKTSGGLANQQRILKARFEDLKGEIGTAFLPVAKDVVTFLNDKAMPAVEEFIDGFKGGKGAGGKARELFETIRDAAGDAAGFVKDIGKAFDDLPEPVKKGLLLGAAGAVVAKKTGIAGAVGKLRGSTPLTPMFVKVVGAGLPGTNLPGTDKPGPGKPRRAGGALGAAAATVAVELIIENLGDKSGPFDPFRKSLKLLPELKGMFGDVDTSAKGLLRSVRDFDKEMSDGVTGDGAAAFGRFQRISERTGLSLKDLGALLPQTRDKINDVGGRAAFAERKTGKWKDTILGAGRELDKIDGRKPKVTINDNVPSVLDGLRDIGRQLDAMTERKHRIRLAIQNNGTGFGFQRASGGPAYAGQQYTVNEHLSGLREQFVPAQDGRILSRRDAMAALAGGRGGVQINVDRVEAQDVNHFLREMQHRAFRADNRG